jgi:hypothetical protein
MGTSTDKERLLALLNYLKNYSVTGQDEISFSMNPIQSIEKLAYRQTELSILLSLAAILEHLDFLCF